MKLTALFLVIGILTVHAKGTAQKVTINEENVPLQKVINIIKKQTGYGFNINLGNLDELPSVTVKVTDGSIKEALEQCLEDLPISYYIGDNYVVLGKKEVLVVKKSLGLVPDDAEGVISGYVYDLDGKPLAEAAVMVKDKPRTLVSTNVNGRFEIKNARIGEVLIVSLVGYATQEIVVKNQEANVIRLSVSSAKLDEVQVIAYGTTTRRLNTGNVGTVKADVIEKQPVTNPLLAIQGRVPGVTVVQNSGVPGGGITVRIQGRNSIASGNDPLYIVDGMPINSQLPALQSEDLILGNSGAVAEGAPLAAGNPLSFLNPADIESIDILKDADATAIYGSRAANGAILITTKQGKTGKTRLDLTFQYGWGKTPRHLKVLNTRQYLDMRYEAYANDNRNWRVPGFRGANDLKVWDTTRYTDWQKELLSGTTQFLTASASVSGGGAGTNYLISGTYGRDGVPFPGDFGNRRTSIHFNINSVAANQKLRFKFSGNFMNHKNDLPSTDPTMAALFLEPNAPAPYNADGTINWAPDAAGNSTFTKNPYRGLMNGGTTVTNNIIGNLSINYRILPGLEIANSIGYTFTQTDRAVFNASGAMPPENRLVTLNSAIYDDRNLNSWITEPQVSYKVNLAGGRLDALIGGTILANKTKLQSISGYNYATDGMLENLGSASAISGWTSVISNYKYAALFGRLNYNWQDRYILNLTARRDGTSRFGINNRFHGFGAIGGAWIFSGTRFVKTVVPWLSSGKIRASYGTTGNDQIADFQYVTRYNRVFVAVPYQGVAGLTPINLPNPNLQWELTKKLSFGTDLGFINDRITFSFNYSRNTSNNQLTSYLLPSVTGFSSYYSNFPGTVRNTNYEFTLISENVKGKGFEWSTNINLTITRNRLIAFPDLASSSYANSLEIGQPLNIQRIAKFVGVNSATGLYEFNNRHGATVSMPTYPDDYISVNLDPSWYGGVANQIKLGNFSIDFFVQIVKQKGFNPTLGNGLVVTPGSFSQGGSNQPVSVLDRWRKPGDQAQIKKFASTVNDVNTGIAYSSTRVYTDASFARLKNVSFSWQMPNSMLKKTGMQSVRFFVQAQNLLTISGYKGLNPEVPSFSPLLPPMRVTTLGTQIIF